jgi:ribonuclease-3
VKDSGPDHQKLFLAEVRVGARELGTGEGRSKKAAEQLAAEAAYRFITAEKAEAEKAEIQSADKERTWPPPDTTTEPPGAGQTSDAP